MPPLQARREAVSQPPEVACHAGANGLPLSYRRDWEFKSAEDEDRSRQETERRQQMAGSN